MINFCYNNRSFKLSHHFLLCAFVSIGLFFLITCSPSSLKRENSNLAYTDPINPINVCDTVKSIYLTDYLPMLAYVCHKEDSIINIKASDHIEILRFTHPQYPKDTISVVKLPQKTRMQNIYSASYDDKSYSVEIRTMNGISLNNVRLIALIQNSMISPKYVLKSDSFARITIDNKIVGRSFLRIYAESDSCLFNDILIPLQDGVPITDVHNLTRHDHNAQIIYSILIDRFCNGDTTNDHKLNSPDVLDIVDYQGGDISGITKAIEDGYFDSLGINTLWISPITQNPLDAWGKYVFKHPNKYNPKLRYTRFSGYHGYWPIYSTVVDFRLGTDRDLKNMIAVAHKDSINVILDYVANHLHINSAIYKNHPDWHTDSILPDGRRNFELWDDARLTTWFDIHLPTLDLERQEICDVMTDSALFWIENYPFDGYRHDACKHIPENYWRQFKRKIVTRFPDKDIWMIGETYGSPQLINSYVRTGMLDAQFDFNVYFTAIRTLCNENSMKKLNEVIIESLNTYGNHHTMGNISGNHDQARWASYAGGAISFDADAKEMGWQRDIGIGDADIAYRRALLLHVLNMTIPGVPCIYQGDEYAETGGNDPDNRHMMRFDRSLNQHEKDFRTKVAELCKFRRSSMPLLYGDYFPITVSDDILVFDRVYLNQKVRVSIDKKNLTYTIQCH